MNVAVDSDRRTTSTTVGGRWDALLIGVLAFAVSVVGAPNPSLWFDESATVSAATRSLPEMADLLRHVDAVHGLYYLVMHAWFAVFPATEGWARVPSALFVGVAAAGVVVLGRQLSTRSVAVAAGVVFAVLPRTTWAGVEARSYALSMVDATWLTVLCVVACRRNRGWLWVAYAVGVALAAVGNVFVLLVVGAHAVLVWGSGPERGRVIRAWLTAVVAATAAVAPYLLVIKSQQGQVSWIWPINPGTLGQILGDQYFPAVYSDSARATGLDAQQTVSPEQVSAALHAWALVAPFIVAVLVLAVVAVRRRARGGPVAGSALLLRLAGAWIAVPTLVVVAYSLVGNPMYQPHYLAFTVPGLALVLGTCVAVVGRDPRWIALILVVLAVAATPNYVAQRGPYAKMAQDSSRVADLVAARAADADCLNVDVTAPPDVVEALTAGRRSAYAKLRDDGLIATGVERGALFESRRPITEWAGALRGCPAVWTITERDRTRPAHERADALDPGPRLGSVAAYRVPAAMGFRAVERWQFNMTQVLRSVPPST